MWTITKSQQIELNFSFDLIRRNVELYTLLWKRRFDVQHYPHALEAGFVDADGILWIFHLNRVNFQQLTHCESTTREKKVQKVKLIQLN